MGKTKKYWKSPEELTGDKQFLKEQENEFPTEMSIDEFLGDDSVQKAGTNRRDFLKFLGFSLGAATIAACEAPVIKSIPYVNKPEEITPGIANWYASTYYDGNDLANVLVKTREGRPIHVAGNNATGVVTGGVNARINSSVISLYNDTRLNWPLHKGEPVSWSTVDSEVATALSGANASNTRILTNTIISPSTKAAIGEFVGKMGGSMAMPAMMNDTIPAMDIDLGGAPPMPASDDNMHITYDAISYNGMRAANKENFGVDGIPAYDFSKAMTIVGIGADFLANWLLGNQYAGQYVMNRKPEGEMSKHYQFEANLTVTGSNADVRTAIKPSQMSAVAVAICKALGGNASGGGDLGDLQGAVDKAVQDLKANRGKSLVVCGSNDMKVQSVVNKINELLGSYGSTIDLDNPLNIKQGDDAEVDNLITAVANGDVKNLIIYGVNPVYSHPRGAELAAALTAGNVTSVSFSMHNDETAQCCTFVCPDNHYLESWNVLEPVNGTYAIVQPTISNLFDTRQAEESFLRWAGNNTSYLDYIKGWWTNNVYSDWNQAVHDGGVVKSKNPASAKSHNGNHMSVDAMTGEGMEVIFFENAAMGDGVHANNPLLQELPDPITKVTWDNYIAMNPNDIDTNGFNMLIGQERPASVAEITVNGSTMRLPVIPSPGQTIGTIGVALGYGRSAGADNIGGGAYQYGRYGDPVQDANGDHDSVGKNIWPMVKSSGDNTMMYCGYAALTGTTETYSLATTQTHHTLMGRYSVVKEIDYNSYKGGKIREFANKPNTLAAHVDHQTVQKPVRDFDLWDAHPVEKVGHRWGLAIDLNTCIGCGTCITACNSENNIPVVGKDEVLRGRDMHWMRLDRYYSSDDDQGHKDWKATGSGEFSYGDMERPSDYPTVTFVPMMCQHCNHAPCETVCPVAATTHSNEGLNQMTYNRCIGTRYCANNCPFKVRRFNWFNYVDYHKFTSFNPSSSDMGRMVLNPDVVVRSRGVMEKCSLCVQNIQAGKLEAKKAGTGVQDGSIQTACSRSCPTNAITFGDYNDTDSKITEENSSDRAYYMLEEVGVQPNITYMTKVRNVDYEIGPNWGDAPVAEAGDHGDAHEEEPAH